MDGRRTDSRRPRTIAVVPLRDGHSGKSRLAGRLTPQQRSEVVTVLATHVVGTLLRADVGRVLVVTNAPDFVRGVLPGDARLDVVPQPADHPGLNAAVTLGRELAATQGGDRLLVVHADLPLLGPADLHALLRRSAQLVLAPDRAGTGTNALVLDTGIPGFRFRFGPGSRDAHLEEAAALGLSTAVVRRPGTWTDLDTAADWAALPAPVRLLLQPTSALVDQ
jgi:2-phospho-L-lactate/phosphoenolpyruvate guanylyltransferase